MNIIKFLKQEFKQNQLIQNVLKPKLQIHSIQSDDKELEQSLTFFNRIIQQVSIINLNHHVISVSSETYFESPSQLRLNNYIPCATSSILNQIDPVYSIQSISPKLLRYQLQLIDGDRQDIQSHISSLQEYNNLISQQITDNLTNNHQFLYQSFVKIQQTYSQLLSLSESISTYRSKLKSHLFKILSMYQRLQIKSNNLRLLKGKMQFLKDFNAKIGVIYNNRRLVYQKLLAISNNLNNLRTNPNLFDKINSLKNLKQKCIIAISQCQLELGKRIKASIFQKHCPQVIYDILISLYLLYYLFKKQKFTILLNSFQQHLKPIQQFISNPTGCNTIKDYLQILYKYLNNLNKFKLYLKSLKISQIIQLIPMTNQSNNITQYYKCLKQQMNKILQKFFNKQYIVLQNVCIQVIKRGNTDDKKIINKFIQMVDQQHLSDGFRHFKKRIKEQIKKY